VYIYHRARLFPSRVCYLAPDSPDGFVLLTGITKLTGLFGPAARRVAAAICL